MGETQGTEQILEKLDRLEKLVSLLIVRTQEKFRKGTKGGSDVK
uniref:Uncharacterized protein n=1 Tax=Setaria italica TaxID=4555 RepID=K3ZGN5_SETIT